MPLYDYRCDNGHVNELLVRYEDRKEQVCPDCGITAKQVWLTAPHLDWAGMAQGENAGPEFVDRFEKSRKQRAKAEQEHTAEHGDALRGAGG